LRAFEVDTDCMQNPTFCNFTKVAIRYCDGFSFVGDRDAPLVVHGRPLYFRGRRILRAVLALLQAKHQLHHAQSVMITGCSAGGLAAILNADMIAGEVRNMAPRISKILAVPSSGFFPDHATISGTRGYGSAMRNAFAMHNAKGTCTAAMLQRGEPVSNCAFAEHAVRHSTTPLFLLQSTVDRWSTACVLTASEAIGSSRAGCDIFYCEDVCSSEKDWLNCTDFWAGTPEMCTDGQIVQLNSFNSDGAQRLRTALNYAHPKSQIFMHSCHFHCGANHFDFWNTWKFDGVTMNEAVSAWWLSNGSLFIGSDHDPCMWHTNASTVNCNPSCATRGIFRSITSNSTRNESQSDDSHFISTSVDYIRGLKV